MSRLRILSFLGVFVVLGSCGGGGGGGSTTPAGSGGGSTTPTQPTNKAPSFTSASNASVVEGTTAALTIEVSDEDTDDTISHSITGGADEDLFELGICNASRCTSNTLSFKTAPNFENPQDANADNDYVVVVQATDATDPVEQTITISVTNAVEGRIVDAPLSDATVCLDTNEDSECGETEPSVTSDSQGYYAVAETSPESGFELRVLSIGGTDILTGKELPSLALIAEVPADPTQAVAVTPLSSVISVATDPQTVIVALGFPETVTPDELTSFDPWALANDSTESSGEFAASADIATAIGITTEELESVADNVVTTSVQIANLVQTADALVTDTTTSGVQSASERAAMISSTVTQELVETIDAAVASAGSAEAASVDLGDATVTNEVLKETTEESAALIVAEIEAKQTAGTLDLSDTNDATVSEILQIKETQEIITQIGLDSSQTENIAAIATIAAETNALIKTQVATAGVAVLTTASSAQDIAGIVSNTSTLAEQLVTGDITTGVFSSSSNVDTQAAASDQLNVAPSINLSGLGSIAEAATLLGSVVASDADGDTLTFSISGTDADKFIISSEGEVSLVAAANYDIQSVYSVTVSVSDGQQTVSEELSVFVTTTPTLNISGLGSIAEAATLLGSVVASDADGDTLTFSISGTDADKFIISSEGELSLVAAADYEAQTSYNVVISVSDGSDTVSKSITVDVTNAIDTPPSLTLAPTISVVENTTVVTQASATDPEGSALSYGLSGMDAATFYISSAGLVSFRAAPDYESLTKTQFTFTVNVTNAGGLTATGNITVNVTDIAENFFDTCQFGSCRFE